MNREKELLTEALLELPDALIEEADAGKIREEAIREKKRKRALWGTLAAAAALVLGLGIGFGPKLLSRPEPSTEATKNAGGYSGTDGGEGEIAVEKHWDEMEDWERYRALYPDASDLGNYSYMTTGKTLEAGKIGESLGQATLIGQDTYNMDDGLNGIRRKDAETFAIRGIAPEAARAVKLGDEYYIYKGWNWFPKTLGEFLEGLSLEEYASYGNLYYNHREGDDYHQAVYAPAPADRIRELLLDSSAKAAPLDRTWDFTGMVSVSITVPELGAENKALHVTRDGYVGFNVLETLNAYYVGPEKTLAFIEWVEEYGDLVEDKVTHMQTNDDPGEVRSSHGYDPGASAATLSPEDQPGVSTTTRGAEDQPGTVTMTTSTE